MAKRIRLVEAKARSSAIVDEVLHNAEHCAVERRGRPVAAIVPTDDLERLQAAQPSLPRPIGALALIGAWGDIEDATLDAFLEDVFRTRTHDAGRPVHIES